MSYPMTSYEQVRNQIATAEVHCRRVCRFCLVIVIGALLVAAMAAAPPATTPPKTTEAGSFVVVDERGTARGVFTSGIPQLFDGAAIALTNAKDQTVVQLGVTDPQTKGVAYVIVGPQGEGDPSASLSVAAEETGDVRVQVAGGKGTPTTFISLLSHPGSKRMLPTAWSGGPSGSPRVVVGGTPEGGTLEIWNEDNQCIRRGGVAPK